MPIIDEGFAQVGQDRPGQTEVQIVKRRGVGSRAPVLSLNVDPARESGPPVNHENLAVIAEIYGGKPPGNESWIKERHGDIVGAQTPGNRRPGIVCTDRID